MNKKYVIVGASAAGISCARTIRTLDTTASITVISQEKESPYNKCFLVDVLSEHKKNQELSILTHEDAQNLNITLVCGEQIISVDRTHKKLCSKNNEYAYDRLLLATGSRPFVPPIFKKKSLSNIFTFYSEQDMHQINAFIHKNPVKRAVIIGAGLTGLEVADALSQLSIETIVIDRSEQILPTFLESDQAAWLHKKMKQQNTHFISDLVFQITEKNNKFCGITLHSGKDITADICILATGFVPNSELAQDAQIVCDEQTIAVNEFLQTSDQSIFAAGDVIAITHNATNTKVRSCTWADAIMQGRIAAYNMVKQEKKYNGSFGTVTSSFFNCSFAASGIYTVNNADFQKYEQITDQSTIKIITKNNRLKGFVLVGNIAHFAYLKRMLFTQQEDNQLMSKIISSVNNTSIIQ